jgi:hypothetical protein
MKAESKAMLYVAKLVGVAMVGSAGTMLALTYIPLNYLAIGMMVASLGFMCKVFYEIALNDIKYKEKLQEMTEK